MRDAQYGRGMESLVAGRGLAATLMINIDVFAGSAVVPATVPCPQRTHFVRHCPFRHFTGILPASRRLHRGQVLDNPEGRVAIDSRRPMQPKTKRVGRLSVS